MTRVTAETNIYISALLFGGLPGAFLDLALMQVFSLVASAALRDELDEKLKDRFHLTALSSPALGGWLVAVR
jgi:predicted nucleic acid-binding protein